MPPFRNEREKGGATGECPQSCERFSELMKPCDQKAELQARLKIAFEEWYSVKDIPDKSREAKEAQKKVHHIQRSLVDHVSKHGCNKG